MKRTSRYRRFEPITVRAAARVLRLASRGVVESRDTRWYLQQLCHLDRYAASDSHAELHRLARLRYPAGRGLHLVACSLVPADLDLIDDEEADDDLNVPR